jgi:hypothetical protein
MGETKNSPISLLLFIKEKGMKSATKSKSRSKPNEIGSLKPNIKKCDFPTCDKYAKYYAVKKGTKHFFCVPHFKEYYNMPNI